MCKTREVSICGESINGSGKEGHWKGEYCLPYMPIQRYRQKIIVPEQQLRHVM